MNTSKSFHEQSKNEEIIETGGSEKVVEGQWRSILEQDIDVVDLNMEKKNQSLGFDPVQEDGIPHAEHQELVAEDSENSSKELGESGENYLDQSQDSMPDFSHLQQQQNFKRLQSKVEKP